MILISQLNRRRNNLLVKIVEINLQNLYSNQIFNDVFASIRDKLFILNDSPEPLLSQEKIDEYDQKWNIKNLHESIDTFKKELGDLYQKKNFIETELNKKKEKYKQFCEYISIKF
jgi:hypothetical protein